MPARVDDHLLWDFWASLYWMPSLTAADELGLFDLLKKGGKDAESIGKELNLAGRPVRGLTGLLSAAGFLEQHNGRYTLTPTARTYLLPDSPYYWGGFFQLIRDWPVSHKDILNALRTNKPTVAEEEVFEITAGSEALAERFTLAMHAVTLAPAEAAAASGLFDEVSTLLDVGGGSGSFSIALAEKNPQTRCTVLELPAVCPIVADFAAKHDLHDRVTAHGCDFFEESWPKDHDAVFFGNIFHNWDRERCLQLAQKAFETLPPGGSMFIHEMLTDDLGDGPLTVTANTMVMIFNHHGQQRSATELARILENAGFSRITTTPTFGYYSITSAVKPSA